MNRDQLLLEMRPQLNLPATEIAQEDFQNRVLRPILKLQNELLIQLVKTHVRSQNKGFNNLKKAEQDLFVSNAMTKQNDLRVAVIHLVVAMFTSEEYSNYKNDKPENNKRIVQMAVQRVLSQLDLLY